MELPPPLRQGVERLLDKVPLPALKQAARTLSERYRAELRDGRLHMADDMAVKAYLAARLPATYAAVRASLDALADALLVLAAFDEQLQRFRHLNELAAVFCAIEAVPVTRSVPRSG